MKKIHYISYLRAISCIAIIILHTFHSSSRYATSISSDSMTVSVTIRNLMMWAVPCFVMISGQLLLTPDRSITYKKLFVKYILRIVIALFAFCFIFEIYDDLFEGKCITTDTVLKSIENALTNGSWSHMWYLYLIIAIYLMLPFFRMIAEKINNKDGIYLLTVYTIFLSIIPLIESFIGKDSAFYICTYTVYPLYLFGGYIISKNKLLNNLITGVILFLSGTAFIVALSIISQLNHLETISSQLTQYSFLPIIFQSFGLYIIMLNLKVKLPKMIDRILMEIDKCSFGIYLIHLMILKTIIAWIEWNPYDYGGTAMVFLLAIFTTVVSYVIIKILKFIPGIRKII